MKHILITVEGPTPDIFSVVDKFYQQLKEFGHSVAKTNVNEDVADMVRLNDYTLLEVER